MLLVAEGAEPVHVWAQRQQGRWVGVKPLRAALQAADSDHHLATMTLRVAANHCIGGAALYMCGP